MGSVLLSGTLFVGIGAAQNSGRNIPHGGWGQERIAKEVRHELVMLPYYGVFGDLEYSVNGNLVTRIGNVTRPKHIEGVERVDNQILVLPLSPNDDRIRRAEYRAIYGRAPLDRYALQAVPPIHIIVANGHVTLVGVVAAQADKDIAGVRANTVNGVFSLDNKLRREGK